MPNTIDGKEVIGVGRGAYKACSSAKSVTISERITYIEAIAFSDCKNLEKVQYSRYDWFQYFCNQ